MTLKQGLKIRILPGRKGNTRILGRRNSMSRGQKSVREAEGKHSWPSQTRSGKGMGQGKTSLAYSLVYSIHQWGSHLGVLCVVRLRAAGPGVWAGSCHQSQFYVCQLHALYLTGPLLRVDIEVAIKASTELGHKAWHTVSAY